ncbi:MAG: efflux RND transporter periplasmic adaptor subunit [Deltaproteobacteria bacterium]|nr:efflux RND transporter periplasmic adaptor subunit [Deltaproteobacteria bacterium]
MPKINKKIISISCIFMLLALFSLRFLPQEKVQVRATEVTIRDITQSVSYSGSIESRTRVRISSKVAGRVSAVFFEELDEVAKGQVLVKLEDDEIKAKLNQLKEALNQAKINRKNAKKNLHRIKELFKKGFASKEQLDNAQQAYDVATALVKQNQSSYEVAHARLEQTSIRAPISGTSVSKNVTVGEIVAGPLSGGGNVAFPTAIAEIADLGNLEVHAGIDELDIGKIEVGQEVSISVDAFPDKTFKGTVKEIALMTSGRREMGITYRVKSNMESPEKLLKLGMTANVDFVIRSKKQVPSVPQKSIFTQGDKRFVFAVNNQEIYRKEIMTGIEGEEFVEVTSGLQPGEKVVIGIKTDVGEDLEERPFGREITPDDNLGLENGQSVVVIP